MSPSVRNRTRAFETIAKVIHVYTHLYIVYTCKYLPTHAFYIAPKCRTERQLADGFSLNIPSQNLLLMDGN